MRGELAVNAAPYDLLPGCQGYLTRAGLFLDRSVAAWSGLPEEPPTDAGQRLEREQLQIRIQAASRS
eukprot:9934208-Alexandrium_andersonii.AAC.1